MKTNGMNEENPVFSGLHSSKQYDQDLEWIRSKVLLMGGLVENQFRDAIVALEKGDVALAEKVVAGDAQVNRQEVELDHACAQLIVRRQPAANDLRNVMATVKVISDLEEQLGDEAAEMRPELCRVHRYPVPSRPIIAHAVVRHVPYGQSTLIHEAL